MTVTITILGNTEYCEDHNLVDVTREPCFCLSGELANPECPVCKGTGEDVIRLYPFELNISNANHGTLWSSLGLWEDDHSYCGQISADKLLEVLKVWIGPELCVRADIHEENFHSYGISLEQATRYQQKLVEIALEAARRKKPVCWG